ncbi:MAG TPA: hypothetical protein VFJ14_01780 [Nocardioidaceae bacterium]|nr:hypothetical protein [Nocardioidaceae bacterium]
MSGLRTIEENIARLEAANEDTRAIIREAHETIQTAKLVLGELRAERERVTADIRAGFDAAIEQQVSAGLAEYAETIEAQTAAAHDSVVKNFDRIQNLLLHGNEQGRGPSLVDDWVRAVVREEIDRLRRGAS